MPGRKNDQEPEGAQETAAGADGVEQPEEADLREGRNAGGADAQTSKDPVNGAPGSHGDELVGSSEPPADDVGNGSETQVETGYAATGRGHRVIRRTTHRRATTEDIEEHIDEEYPLPAAYPVPGSTHPAPVG
jgi:hypothetical protein